MLLVLVLAMGIPLLLCSQTLNMSRALVAKGVATANLVPDSPSLDARPLFEAALGYAAQNGIRTLIGGSGHMLRAHDGEFHVGLSTAPVHPDHGGLGACGGPVIFTFNPIPGYETPADFDANRAPDGSDAIWMFIFRNGVPIQQVGLALNGHHRKSH